MVSRKISTKFLKELRKLEAELGREGLWVAAEEAEGQLPKPGRKRGPIYRIEQGVDRMLALRLAEPKRSFRTVSEQAGREFNISDETLRIEERKRRATKTPAPESLPIQEPQPEAPPASPPDRSPELRAKVAELVRYYAPYIKQIEKDAAAWFESERNRELAAQAGQAIAQLHKQMEVLGADQFKTIQRLVSHPNWRDILGGLGEK